MRTRAVLAIAALLASGLVAGCGGSNTYCDSVKADAATLTNFTSPDVQPDFAKIPDFLADAKDLQRKAPGDVSDDWVVITSTLDSLADSLKDAGLTFAEFATFLNSGKLPADVTQAETAAVELKYQQLGADIVTRAANAITRQAAGSCKVDLTRKS